MYFNTTLRCIPYKIPFNPIRKLATATAYPLEYTFNVTYLSGERASCWKLVFITPIPKKALHHLLSNYRANSTTPVSARVFERKLKAALVSISSLRNLLPVICMATWQFSQASTATYATFFVGEETASLSVTNPKLPGALRTPTRCPSYGFESSPPDLASGPEIRHRCRKGDQATKHDKRCFARRRCWISYLNWTAWLLHLPYF